MAYVCVNLHVYVYVYIYIYVYVHVYVHLQADFCVYVPLCAYVDVYRIEKKSLTKLTELQLLAILVGIRTVVAVVITAWPCFAYV